jgi:hypothetical protein
MPTFEEYWNAYDETVEEERGGGGIVARVLIETGYKVYASGHSQEETFFAAPSYDKEAKKKAKAAATKFANENGARRPQFGIQIRAYREGALSRGEPVSWSKDRFFVTDSWTDAAKQVVVPSLRENRIMPPFEGWARIGFKPDPFGREEEGPDGELRPVRVAYIVETYASEQEAKAGGGGEIPFVDDLPAGWTPKMWDKLIAEIKEAGMSVNEAMEEYGFGSDVRSYLEKALA